MQGLPILLTGLLIGLLSGMFGFGGSSISTPLLRVLFLIPPYYALASPLPMTVFSSSVATYRYWREGLVDWRIVFKLLVFMIPGSIIGAFLTKYIPGKYLMLLTALFLIYISLRFIFKREKRSRRVESRVLIYFLGFIIGLLSGLLANGGGILIVPILYILGVDLKRAIGSSVALVLLGVIPAVVVHAYLGHIDWMITLFLSLGAIPASYIGASLTLRFSRARLKVLYGLFLLLVSIYFGIFELVHW
ncbi:putative permease [Aciduliprofundum sp. MAR08-339]|uniref:sulfite exporter TauE/SafE family protein n=1 Tax=Aciduliprofundum sp. (strain MAR08-339) TaxID=673860 RepID=UPI0002A4AFB5|nr:putative permease [Aciduliprofundum sp. MAR08-339]